MSRPTGRDETVIRDAAKGAVKELRLWLGNDSGQYTDEQLIDDLSKSIRYGFDGFEMAKAMERSGYGADSNAVARWVKQFDVKPPFPIGTIVAYEDTTGEITAHDELHGKATVCVASRGHVKQGTGTHGFLIAWEKLSIPTTSKQEVSG